MRNFKNILIALLLIASFSCKGQMIVGGFGNQQKNRDVNSSPSAPDVTAPTAPSDVVATNITNNSVELDWTASTDAVGVVNYKIYDKFPTPDVLLGQTGNSDNFKTITGLDPETLYQIYVVAVDAANNHSDGSSPSEDITTDALPDTFLVEVGDVISGGVYDSNDRKLRTLFSGIAEAPGTYDESYFTWNGLDDDGVDVTATATHYKIVKNRINETWGVLGNTSDDLTGSTVHHHYNTYFDGFVEGNSYLWLALDYGEQSPTITKIDLTDLQSKINLMSHPKVYPAFSRFAWDGTTIYMGGRSADTSQEHNGFLAAATPANLNSLGSWLPFQGVTFDIFNQTPDYRITALTTQTVGVEPRCTGLAVQVSGNYVILAREEVNSVQVIHKTTGIVAQTYTLTKPKHCKVNPADDSKVWIVVNEVFTEYSINSGTGALTATGTTITGFEDVHAAAFKADGSIFAIADAAAAAHRIFGYETTTYTVSWTLGRNESYGTSSTVYNDKFRFKSYRNEGTSQYYDDSYTFIAFQANGYLWVGDKENHRYLQFDASRNYVDGIYWKPGFYSSGAVKGETTRVLADWLEYEVDWTQPLASSWTLKRNWVGVAGTGNFNTDSNRILINPVKHTSNGKTYAFLPSSSNWRFIELVTDGVMRDTGVTVSSSNYTTYQKDGILYRVSGTGSGNDTGTMTMYSRPITFDGSNNPVLGTETSWGSTTYAADEPTNGYYIYNTSGQITSGGVWAIYEPFNKHNGGVSALGMKVGGIKTGDTDYRFKSSPAVVYSSGADYPTDGSFDARTSVGYAGNKALGLPDQNWFAVGANNEFWRSAQTNMFNLWHESGLFLGQVGVADTDGQSGEAQFGMAGNSFGWDLFKTPGGVIKLITNDESYHSGIGVWTIQDTDTIQEYDIQMNDSTGLFIVLISLFAITFLADFVNRRILKRKKR